MAVTPQDYSGTWVNYDFLDNSLYTIPDYIYTGATTLVLYINFTGADASSVLYLNILGDYGIDDWYNTSIYAGDATTGITVLSPNTYKISGSGSKKMVVMLDTTGIIRIKGTIQIITGTAIGSNFTCKFHSTDTRDSGGKL